MNSTSPCCNFIDGRREEERIRWSHTRIQQRRKRARTSKLAAESLAEISLLSPDDVFIQLNRQYVWRAVCDFEQEIHVKSSGAALVDKEVESRSTVKP